MIRFAILVLAVAACTPKQPPKVFRTSLPALEVPELQELPPPTADAIPAPAAMKPGTRPPYVDASCKATHRAQLVPEDQVGEFLRDQELGTFWSKRAGEERTGRLTDRAYCETVAEDFGVENQALRQDNRVLRYAAPAALVVGIFLGALARSAGSALGGS